MTDKEKRNDYIVIGIIIGVVLFATLQHVLIHVIGVPVK